MARIRSIHPGFFSDENLVSVSMAARLLFLGLGVEADDKGVFEWKPLTLKMRIFPGDNIDVVALLAELEGINAVRQYEIDSRKYGAIRNFRKFQKPKTPNDIHPIPDDFRNYVGLPQPISETFPPKREAFPQEGEIVRQMEDGEEGKGSTTPKLISNEISCGRSDATATTNLSSEHRISIDAVDVRRRCAEAIGRDFEKGFGSIVEIIRSGVDFEGRVLPLLQSLRGDAKINSWRYAAKIIEDPHRHPPPARQENVFVQKGTSAWLAWEKFRGKSLPSAKGQNGSAEGWWFPSEFPSSGEVAKGALYEG